MAAEREGNWLEPIPLVRKSFGDVEKLKKRVAELEERERELKLDKDILLEKLEQRPLKFDEM